MKTLAQLRAECAAALERMQEALKDVENPQEGADEAALRTKFDEAKATHASAVEAYDRAAAVEEARAALPAPPAEEKEEPVEERKAGSPEVRVGNEPLTYEQREQDGSISRRSIFADMYAVRYGGDAGARERLERHNQEMQVESRAALSQTAGEGGEIIPPVYLQQKWIALPRASRPIANTLNKQPWISGTNSINIPKIESGTAVAVQKDGEAVKETKAKTQEITAAAQTVAGQQAISQQLIDFSVPGIDGIIFDDLSRAYDTELDRLVIGGTVTNAKGLNEVSGTNAVTFTESTPKAGKFYPKLASAIAEVSAGIFAPPTVIAMTPQRWAWILSSTDTAERPLVVPVGQPGFNAFGLQERVAAENIVGTIQGLPVIIDASIPKTKGAGTNQDEVFVYRADQLYLWESTPVLRLLEQTKAEKLEQLAQIYGYYFLMLGRLPKAISKIEGTGLAAPSF